jgi:hypothetical protein
MTNSAHATPAAFSHRLMREAAAAELLTVGAGFGAGPGMMGMEANGRYGR